MGHCCAAGQLVDACGYCGGSNNTCGTMIRLVIVVDPSVDADAASAVETYVAERLQYPLGLVHVRELETLDVTEMIPFVGLLEDVLDADAFMEDTEDLVFGRVCC